MTANSNVAQALERGVRAALGRELGARGLMTEAAASVSAMAFQRQRGAALLGELVEHCYGVAVGTGVRVEFGEEADAQRVELALAFGALAGSLLAPVATGGAPLAELLPATFNLGIGLIDGLCDRNPAIGIPLLDVVASADLRTGAAQGWPAGFLTGALSTALLADPAAAFTARVVEAVLELLHAQYPGPTGAETRAAAGRLLQQALEAEQRSVAWDVGADRESLVEASRQTSVLPFRVIELLATADPSPAEPTAGSLLGEAMWLLDDLVDLVPDLDHGALNGVVLRASPTADHQHAEVLAQFLRSGIVDATAGSAADLLRQGLDLCPGSGEDNLAFLAFVQTYAGLASMDEGAPGP